MANKEKFAEEDAMGYNIQIIAKNFPLTEPMRQYIWNKLSKIERFHNHILNVHVTLEIQRLEHVCTIICHYNHFQVKTQADSTDMYTSIDRAIDKLQVLFRKWKGRIQDYNKKPLRAVDMVVNVHRRPVSEPTETDEINEQIEEENMRKWQPGKVVETQKRALKTLSTEDAVMKMELSGEHFLVYRDEVDQKIKVIYHHSAEDYGILQVE